MTTSSSIARQLVSGGQWATFNKILTALSALVFNALLTRLLVPEEVGAYYIVASIVSIGLLLALLGTSQGIVRLLSAALASNNMAMPRKAIKSCLVLAACGTATVALSYHAAVGEYLGEMLFDSKMVVGATTLTALWIAARAIQTFQAQTFRAFHRIDLASTFEGSVTGILLVIFLAGAWFLKVNLDLSQILVLTLIALTIAIAIGLVFSTRLYLSTGKSTGMEMPNTLTICLPLFVSSVALQSMNELHVWILGSNSSEEQVALFGAAFRLAKFVVIPLIVINSVIPPMIARLYHEERYVEMENVLRTTATVAAIPSLLIVVFLGIGANFFLSFIFGEFYGDGANILIILLAAQLVNSLVGSPGVVLSMSNEQNVVMFSGLLAGTISLAISAVLIPSFQATGAAIGLATGLVVHNLVMWCYCAYKLEILTHMRFISLQELIKFSHMIKSK